MSGGRGPRGGRAVPEGANVDYPQRLAAQVWQSAHGTQESGQTLFRLFMFDRWLEVFGIAVEAAPLRNVA